jgi:hypothetical protein
MSAASKPKAPRQALIKFGRGALTVSAYPDGSVSLGLGDASLGVTAHLSRDEASELIAALAPPTAALIETLDLLVSAAEEHCPSPLTDDPEVAAEARELRSRIADARALLKEHAS